MDSEDGRGYFRTSRVLQSKLMVRELSGIKINPVIVEGLDYDR